jgi:hypothetical protein
MRVYRVENDEGLGVYQSTVAFRLDRFGHPMGQKLSDHIYGMPTPNVDFSSEDYSRIYFNSNYRYACESMEQLKRWFPPILLKIFKRQGFKIVAYEVDKEHVVLGRNQLVFHLSHARRI